MDKLTAKEAQKAGEMILAEYMKMMTPAKQKEFISKKYNCFYPAPEVTRAEREVIMYITTRFFFPHGIEGEAMDNTVLEWESLDKAIAYCHR